MKALSVEKCIYEGKFEVNALFDFVKVNAENFNAYKMEKAVFSRILDIGLAVMKGYFAAKGTGDIGPELVLEDGTSLKKESENSFRGRDYYSVFGKIKVPRTCYRIEGSPGVMPLDAQADMPERCYSYLLQEWMDFFSIRDTFQESQLSLKELLGLKVSSSRFEVISRDTSKNYDEFYKTKEFPSPDSEGEIQAISFDGKGVPVIKKEGAKIKAKKGKGEKSQKKKEALVGVSYTVDQKERTPDEVAENLVYPDKEKEKKIGKETIKAQNIRRMASLERTKKEVIEEIVNDARNRDPDKKRPWVVLMDGDLNLWDLVGTVLKDVNYVGILDIIHVTEYLWKAATGLYGEKNPERKEWVYEHLLSILRGEVVHVISELDLILNEQELKKGQTDALKEAIRYFDNHQEWMQYDKYLAAGYPIATGVVESSCGHTVKNRMEGTGRRWSIIGAEATLLLRSVYTSNDWNAYWKKHMSIERERLYRYILDSVGYADDYYLEHNLAA